MKTKRAVRTAILGFLMGAAAALPCAAQQLIAWPIGAPTPLRAMMPGLPILPLPPRPLPRPGPAPMPVPTPSEPAPLTLSGYRVEGRVAGSAAELAYTITFHNPTGSRLEGVLVQPIPAGTVLSGFTMTAGGKTLKGELLEAGQAATIYENIVRQMRDPGLLELVGERMIRARVFPIEPNSDIVVRLTLAQTLERSGELYSLRVPMRSAAMSGSVTRGASARIVVTAADPIGSINSSLSGVKIARKGEREATVTYDTDAAAGGDLDLFYSLRRGALSASVLQFKETGEDGFFLVSLSPKAEAGPGETVPKDILFVVDRSGSMEEGGKMTQAKAALSYCIRKLDDQDRFAIVDFATGVNLFESSLSAGTEANKARALRYVSKLEASGGTNIQAALAEGLPLLAEHPGRMSMVFFLTDGLPTVGETRVEELLRQAAAKNKSLGARLFTFGVGSDVNTLFLDKLAEANRGARDYVGAGEDIEVKVSALYQKVAKPAMTDVKLDWRGVEVSELYPRPVGDLFYGGELMMMGRFHGGGRGTLVVTGKAAGKPVRFEYPVALHGESGGESFLPRLWANRKVAHELDGIRLTGRADPEVVASIVKLAKRYGIVTPYTSFLITEEGAGAGNLNGVRQMEALRRDAFDSGFSGGGVLAARAQKASLGLSAVRGAAMAAPGAAGSAASAMEADARQELRDKGIAAVPTRSIGAKTFYFRNGVWEDGALDEGQGLKTRGIRYLGDEYFELLKRHPGIGQYLSLGARVVVVVNGTAYRIGE